MVILKIFDLVNFGMVADLNLVRSEAQQVSADHLGETGLHPKEIETVRGTDYFSTFLEGL